MIDQRTYDLTTKASAEREVRLLVSAKEGTRLKVFVVVGSNRRKEMVNDSLNAICFLLFTLFLSVYILTEKIDVTSLIVGVIALTYMAYLIHLRWRSSYKADKRGEVVTKIFQRNGEPMDVELGKSVANNIRKLILNTRSNT